MPNINCDTCQKITYKTETEFRYWKTHYCSKQCQTQRQKLKIQKNCHECNAVIDIFPSRLREKNFCSKSCVGKYSVYKCRKAKVTKRSRLEIYLENELRLIFPELSIECNYSLPENRLELDFYFPELNLGIEINGLYHYEPIKGGVSNFERVQKNDSLKEELCMKLGIELISIKTIESFKDKKATMSHLKTVTDILLLKLKQSR